MCNVKENNGYMTQKVSIFPLFYVLFQFFFFFFGIILAYFFSLNNMTCVLFGFALQATYVNHLIAKNANCAYLKMLLPHFAYQRLCFTKIGSYYTKTHTHTEQWLTKRKIFIILFAFAHSDEIISVSTQKVAKVGGDGSVNIGSPKFSDEIYLTDDYYGNSK